SVRIRPEQDDFSAKCHPAPGFWRSMIFSENRFTLFGIMLCDCLPVEAAVGVPVAPVADIAAAVAPAVEAVRAETPAAIAAVIPAVIAMEAMVSAAMPSAPGGRRGRRHRRGAESGGCDERQCEFAKHEHVSSLSERA